MTVIALADHMPTQEIPIWSGQPEVTTYVRRSIPRRIATSQFIADVRTHRFVAWVCVSAGTVLGLTIGGVA